MTLTKEQLQEFEVFGNFELSSQEANYNDSGYYNVFIEDQAESISKNKSLVFNYSISQYCDRDKNPNGHIDVNVFDFEYFEDGSEVKLSLMDIVLLTDVFIDKVRDKIT